MSEKTDDFERLKLLYQENGTMFRFYLTWRQLLLAGYFAILAALALGFRWSLSSAKGISCIFPFAGAGMGILFWALDYRNRQLYTHVGSVGRELESRLGFPGLGYYGAYKQARGWITHGKILTVLYFGCAVLLLVAGMMAARDLLPPVTPSH